MQRQQPGQVSLIGYSNGTVVGVQNLPKMDMLKIPCPHGCQCPRVWTCEILLFTRSSFSYILSDAMTLSGVHNKHHYHITVIALLYLVRCMLGACSGRATWPAS